MESNGIFVAFFIFLFFFRSFMQFLFDFFVHYKQKLSIIYFHFRIDELVLISFGSTVIGLQVSYYFYFKHGAGLINN